VVVGLAAFAAPAAAQAPVVAIVPKCVEPAPCVYVTPDPDVVKEVEAPYLFQGQGWRPRAVVTITFDEFCPPNATCDNGSETVRVRPDQHGKFTFTIRYGGRVGGLPRPAASGHPIGVRFEQRRGRGNVTRDALAVPPPSTPAERIEARAVARAVQRAHVALEKKEDAAFARFRGAVKAMRRCRGEGNGTLPPDYILDVDDAMSHLLLDYAEHAAVDGELRRFADDLERLQIQEPTLRAAADVWIAAIRRPRPWTVKRTCEEWARWRAAGYPRDRPPLDPSEEAVGAQSFGSTIAFSEPIKAGGRRLRALGAGRRSGLRFAGELIFAASEFDGMFG
jgi:hypothetical protein